MWKDEIYTIYRLSNAFRHTPVTLPRQNITLLELERILGVNLQYAAAPTFGINGHGASVLLTHDNDLHVKGWNLHILPHSKCSSLHCRNKHNVLGFWFGE